MAAKQKQIRLLRADEIECRIGTINKNGLSLLLYKDSRCDMKMMDEVYGPLNWQRRHVIIGGNLYCEVSVFDSEKAQWISKMDVGTKSNTEEIKGESSDAFKRACVNFGIGRELYTAPFIWIAASKTRIENNDKGKLVCKDVFKVATISYNENREITDLVIMNQNGKAVYSLIKNATAITSEENAMQKADNGISQEEKAQAIGKELQRTGVALSAVLERYGINSLADMNDDQYNKAMSSLRRTKAAA